MGWVGLGSPGVLLCDCIPAYRNFLARSFERNSLFTPAMSESSATRDAPVEPVSLVSARLSSALLVEQDLQQRLHRKLVCPLLTVGAGAVAVFGARSLHVWTAARQSLSLAGTVIALLATWLLAAFVLPSDRRTPYAASALVAAVSILVAGLYAPSVANLADALDSCAYEDTCANALGADGVGFHRAPLAIACTARDLCERVLIIELARGMATLSALAAACLNIAFHLATRSPPVRMRLVLMRTAQMAWALHLIVVMGTRLIYFHAFHYDAAFGVRCVPACATCGSEHAFGRSP